MPDWFYRTLAQRALFALPGNGGRSVAINVIGFLGRTRPGRALIEFMGHMSPDYRIAVEVGGVRFASPIGLGWRVDPDHCASEALAEFGIGALEVREENVYDVRRGTGEELEDFAGAVRSSPREGALRIPVLRRRWVEGFETIVWPSGNVFPVKAWDQIPTAADAKILTGLLLQVGQRGDQGCWRVPACGPRGLTEQIIRWRSLLEKSKPLIIAGGVSGPEDARALIAAGADFILVDSGLVFRGPGLIKRCNEALLTRSFVDANVAEFPPANRLIPIPFFRSAWPWAVGLGAALLVGGMLTLGLATTRVLLPYDEQYLGITSEALRRNLPRLFAFMAHDRGTLAGTMIGLGWLYLCLGTQAIRRSVPGMKTALVASALAGFVSFFAFFGFGYFDTLHAFVAAILFQLTIQIMVGLTGDAAEVRPSIDPEDRSWMMAQWGQLGWIIHAVGLLIAGGTILGIGMTSVLVKEDLNFLCLGADQVQALGSKMFGVVAHDRATLGGMLLASGVGMLLPCLWGFRRGAGWLWIAIAGLGLPAYVVAIGVHLWVGYIDWRHLGPALAGCLLWGAGLGLSRRYLCEGK